VHVVWKTGENSLPALAAPLPGECFSLPQKFSKIVEFSTAFKDNLAKFAYDV
jgi:hypothetical protein